jgi:diguanylate cyclase (GGDEF)-like protein/PAS domain S-box-containing protein
LKKKFNSCKGILCRKDEREQHFLGKNCYCCPMKRRNIEVIYVFDVESRKIVETNDAFWEMLKYKPEDLRELYVDDIVVADRQEIELTINEFLNQGIGEIGLRQYRCKDGEMLFVESSVEAASSHNQQFISVRMRDVTEWQHLQNRLRLAAQVFDSASDGILVTDVEGVIQFANPAFLSNTGYSLEELMGMTPRILKSGRQEDAFYQDMWGCLHDIGQWKGEIWNKRKNGEIYSEWLVIDAIKNDLGQVTMYSGIFRDLTERKRYEEQIKYQAYHDGLTGLANRGLFYEQVKQSIILAKRYHHMIAIMYVDLDGFKHVNDNFGHNIGDLLLKEVAKCLKECVRENDFVARMGGDEFTVILPQMVCYQEAELVAQKIQKTLNIPFDLEGSVVTISSSIGVSIFPNHGEEVDALIKKADNAMYQAKASGKNTYRFSNG